IGDHDDRVVASVDELVDRADLRGHILADAYHLEFRNVRLHVRLLGVGLARLHHLDAPGVPDIPVDEGDAERAFLSRVLQILHVGVARRETCRIGARSADFLGTRNCTTDEERRESQGRNSTQTVAKCPQCCVHGGTPVIRAGSLLRLRANSAAWWSIVEQTPSAFSTDWRRYWGPARPSINCDGPFALDYVRSRCYPRLGSAPCHLDG